MGNTERRNVIVVGAGASKEFDLPTGVELMDHLRNLADLEFQDHQNFKGDYRLYETFKIDAKQQPSYDGTANDYLYAAWKIRDNMPLAPSIDNFLHTHKDDQTLVKVGKILIAKAILDAERKSTLFVDQQTRQPKINFSRGKRKDVSPPSWTWLGELFRLLVTERNFEEFLQATQNITFISFNYDRCIQQFLGYAAASYFSLDSDKVFQVIESIKVIHPYGSLGELSLQPRVNVGFGGEVYGNQLLTLADKIQTFTEGSVSKTLEKDVNTAFGNCQVVLFLGFGFLPLNMRLLFGAKKFQIGHIIGTSMGISENSTGIIEDELYEALVRGDPHEIGLKRDGQVRLSSTTCRKLFVEFNRFLLD